MLLLLVLFHLLCSAIPVSLPILSVLPLALASPMGLLCHSLEIFPSLC